MVGSRHIHLEEDSPRSHQEVGRRNHHHNLVEGSLADIPGESSLVADSPEEVADCCCVFPSICLGDLAPYLRLEEGGIAVVGRPEEKFVHSCCCCLETGYNMNRQHHDLLDDRLHVRSLRLAAAQRNAHRHQHHLEIARRCLCCRDCWDLTFHLCPEKARRKLKLKWPST